jgi:hypothetical protein
LAKTEQEKLGDEILALKREFPGSTASERADRLLAASFNGNRPTEGLYTIPRTEKATDDQSG